MVKQVTAALYNSKKLSIGHVLTMESGFIFVME